METSNDYLYRCLDVLNADKSLSEATLIIMFKQYAEMYCQEKKFMKWKTSENKPKKIGKYLVHKLKGKVGLESWNGENWVNDEDLITHWAVISLPEKEMK
jgi:hypothetical protein